MAGLGELGGLGGQAGGRAGAVVAANLRLCGKAILKREKSAMHMWYGGGGGVAGGKNSGKNGLQHRWDI